VLEQHYHCESPLRNQGGRKKSSPLEIRGKQKRFFGRSVIRFSGSGYCPARIASSKINRLAANFNQSHDVRVIAFVQADYCVHEKSFIVSAPRAFKTCLSLSLLSLTSLSATVFPS
jgi:hypothetical protein